MSRTIPTSSVDGRLKPTRVKTLSGSGGQEPLLLLTSLGQEPPRVATWRWRRSGHHHLMRRWLRERRRAVGSIKSPHVGQRFKVGGMGCRPRAAGSLKWGRADGRRRRSDGNRRRRRNRARTAHFAVLGSFNWTDGPAAATGRRSDGRRGSGRGADDGIDGEADLGLDDGQGRRL